MGAVKQYKESQLRSIRFELRMQPIVRAQIKMVAQNTRRTVTSILDEAIEDVVKKYSTEAMTK